MKQYEVQNKDEFMYGKLFVYEFESISEVIKFVETKEINRKSFEGGKVTSDIRGEMAKYFTRTKSLPHAKQLLVSGHTVSAKQLTQKLNIKNAQTSEKEKKQLVYDVVGFQASVPRYLQGIPTNMISKKVVNVKQKVINLNKSIAYSASVSVQKIEDDSVEFLQLIQLLERQGFRVNAYVTLISKVYSEIVCYKVKVKSASERLNISKMSFPLTHPSFLRRIMFAVIERDERLTNNWYSGYGSPQDNTNNLISDAMNILKKRSQTKEEQIYIRTLLSKEQKEQIISNLNNVN